MSNVDHLLKLNHLTDDEIATLISALSEGEGGIFTTGDAVQFVQWASGVIATAVLIGLALDGRATVTWSGEDDDWAWSMKEDV
jgi:hypothetical protein